MTMKPYLLVVMAAMFLPGTAYAQMGGGGGDAVVTINANPNAENFIFEPPSKWSPYSSETAAKRVTMYIPFGQKPDKFKETLTFTEFSSTLNATSAGQIRDVLVKGSTKACPTQSVQEGRDRDENGYLATSWEETCDTGDHYEFSMNKVILGNDKLYTAKKVWRYEPDQEEKNEWQTNMQGVFVCDPRAGRDHSCTGGRGGGMGGGMGGGQRPNLAIIKLTLVPTRAR